MTHTKDPKQAVGDGLSSCGEIFHQHSDKAIKACIWILAAMCVALLVITIYMANPPKKLKKIPDYQTAVELEGRLLSIADHATVNGACQLNGDCAVDCLNTSGIYKNVYQTLEAVSCENGVALNIYNQRFPNLVLTNRWIPANKVIKEVAIVNANYNHVRNEAFNCIDFTNTEVLKLDGVNLSALGNGVLLGLSKLSTLNIVGRVGQIDRCFFQPVQSSLSRLRLSAELAIAGDKSIFGISYLPKIVGLDLSDNIISGSLSRSFFSAVPNVECLTLSNSKITSIDEDAFDDIADTLHLLDLSNNLLTSIDVRSIERLLILGKINLYLLGNDWYCNCDLKSLISLYHTYEARFADVPYCKGPLALYGVLFTNVTFADECDSKSDEEWAIETTPHAVEPTPSINTSSSAVMNPTKEIPTTDEPSGYPLPFQMRCLSVLSLPSDEDSSNSEQMEYFLFAPPCHEFELVLLNNNSVQVVVENANEPINIVWFSDAVENFVYTIEGITVDYNCEAYTDPYLIVDNLLENSTYTFCLVPDGSYSITPFNCLPLHVPIRISNDDSVWITNDEKQFTVGIVCLIFLCSMLLGGVIAYFGIKAYPDLLEGSRHVLVVKKSDQTCYVSTITEGEYMVNQTIQKNSLKKKKCSLNSTVLSSFQPGQFNSFPSMPPPTTPTLPPLPILQKSEETSNESLREIEDHYELPCVYNQPHERQCLPNKYEMSPTSPPPLPKRNSDIVLYSTNSELEKNSERFHPKMSF